MEATVIFPHQLFGRHPSIRRGRPVYLVEDQRYFGDPETSIHFHKNKLVLHRASMKAYQRAFAMAGHDVRYIEYKQSPSIDYLFNQLTASGVTILNLAESADSLLEKRLTEKASQTGITLHVDPSPSFLTDPAWLREFFGNTTHFSMTSFYIAQRKRLNILLNRGKPAGGRWTFDTANRERLPSSISTTSPKLPTPSAFVRDAQSYVQQNFPNNPGDASSFFYPITHDEAVDWLHDFLEKRLENFGKYQDAIRKEETTIFHSLLSTSLNAGLLTPEEVVSEVLDYSQAQGDTVPLNSLEGFVRQIIGWREFVRAVYILKGDAQRTKNFWGHTRKLPDAFYSGTTGIEPVDTAINRLHQHAYLHHIERLMVLGNFMLLSEIDPDEVYRWFMEMFIDAYDWVMVPNIYGMSQYADGGLMTTKPYISSSRYILKMSDYAQGPWCKIWDALYWRFIDKHRDVFRKIPRMSVMVSAFDRMPAEKRNINLSLAENFLTTL